MSWLDDAARRVAGVRGVPAVCVLDLDSTLIDTAHRHLRILRAFAEEHAELRALVASLSPADMGYRVEAPLLARGVDDPRLLDALRGQWRRRFFTSDLCQHDEPTPGAVAAVRRLWGEGAHVVYLSARPAGSMARGTVLSLLSAGFPLVEGRAQVMLKPVASMSDAAFKADALSTVAAMGQVALTMDNEPGHCNRFAEAFPAALHVWVDTVHSPDAPPLRPDVLRVRPPL